MAEPVVDGWTVLESAVARVRFLAPPTITRVEGQHEIRSGSRMPPSIPDQMEEFTRAARSMDGLSASHFTGLTKVPGLPLGAVDVRECSLAALARNGRFAVLREYRVPGAVLLGAGSAAQRYVDGYTADLVLLLGSQEWAVVSAHATDVAEIVELTRVLRSARPLAE